MQDNTRLIIIICLILLAILIAFLLVRNAHKTRLKKELDDLTVRFTKVTTVPLAFKLNKAKAMAKLDNDMKQEVDVYYEKYEKAQHNLDSLQEMLNGIEDSMSSRKYKEVLEALAVVSDTLKDCEEEVNDIDHYLDRYVEKENAQRDYSNTLKESFRNLKYAVNSKTGELAYSMDGINERLVEIETLFSSSEEWMYGNEYGKAQENLEKIAAAINSINTDIEILPDLDKQARGIIPTLANELKRQYDLALQRGIYLKHLDYDNLVQNSESLLKKDLKTLLNGKTDDVADDLENIRNTYNSLLESISKENVAFHDLPKASDAIAKEIAELSRIENYLEIVYDKEKERYNLEDLREILPREKETIANYSNLFNDLKRKIALHDEAATLTIKEAGDLFEEVRKDKDYLCSIKDKVDDTSNGEARAKSQVIKLQVVLNEVEVKIAQYRLPAISSSYQDDLNKGHDYVYQIEDLLKEIPLRIDELNKILDEAIDFIYRLYNNVNNVVGMALMVENTIVFGNKYRSTYPEIDRELSRAEFSYWNGEYTKALKTALSCMEILFPNSADDRILENAKSGR